MAIAPEDLLDFWFNQIGPTQWFTANAERDTLMTERYLEMHQRAMHGALTAWESNPTGMLSLMLLLDQFPRHMFRNTPSAYATDELALELARTAIIKHFDDRIDAACKFCFYLPFAHSENMGDQRLALFYVRERTKNPDWLNYAEDCFHIVQKFDRFPQRNKILGRASSKAEEDYLRQTTALALAS
jgi:uncharacterized protein (DUF924 family)